MPSLTVETFDAAAQAANKRSVMEAAMQASPTSGAPTVAITSIRPAGGRRLAGARRLASLLGLGRRLTDTGIIVDTSVTYPPGESSAAQGLMQQVTSTPDAVVPGATIQAVTYTETVPPSPPPAVTRWAPADVAQAGAKGCCRWVSGGHAAAKAAGLPARRLKCVPPLPVPPTPSLPLLSLCAAPLPRHSPLFLHHLKPSPLPPPLHRRRRRRRRALRRRRRSLPQPLVPQSPSA